MYLKDITVPIPFDQGRIVIRGEKRVEMELCRAYSDETQDSRVRRKAIGQVAPLYTDRMYPNENYFALVKNDVPAETRDAFLLRCAKQREITELRKDPAAMKRRVDEGIRYLKDQGRTISGGETAPAASPRVPWYITDEHDLRYAMNVFSDLYTVMEAYAMRHPNSVLAGYKVRMFNRILNELKATLPDHQVIQGLDLIEEPREQTDAEGNTRMTGMTNSDALMLLTWYKDAIKT